MENQQNSPKPSRRNTFRITLITASVLVFGILYFYSCEDHLQELNTIPVNQSSSISNETNVKDVEDFQRRRYSSQISQNRILLAKALIEARNNDSKIITSIINSCNKEFDGDKDLLVSDIISSSSDLRTFSVLNYQRPAKSEFQALNSSITKNFTTSNFLENDKLVQFYNYVGNVEKVAEPVGVVIVPENFHDKKERYVLAMNWKNEAFLLNVKIAPKENYIVISTNERSSLDFQKALNRSRGDNLKVNFAGREDVGNDDEGASSSSSNRFQNNKSFVFNGARFSSMEAIRTYESWIRGQPEVRVQVLYSNKDALPNSLGYHEKFYFPNDWYEGCGFLGLNCMSSN